MKCSGPIYYWCLLDFFIKKRDLDFVIVFVVGSILVFSSFANSQESVPDSASSAQIEKRLEQPIQPKSTLKDNGFFKNGDQSASMPASLSLKIATIKIQGSSVYSKKELEVYYQNLIGTTLQLNQLFDVAEAITKRYRDDGYIFSNAVIPAGQQLDVAGANVVVEITEGYIDQIKYQNHQYDSGEKGKLISEYLNKIKSICYKPQVDYSRPCPLHNDILERYILLAKDLSGYDLDVTMLRGSQRGAVNLFVTIQEVKFSGFISADNRGSEFIGPLQIRAGFKVNSVFSSIDSTAFEVLTTDDKDEVTLFKINESLALGSEGFNMYFSGSYSESVPGDTLKVLEIESKSLNINAGFHYPIIRTRSTNLYVNGEFTHRNQKTDIFGISLSEDKLRILRIGLTYDKTDGVGGGGVSLLDLTIHQGIHAMDASKKESPDTTRPAGNSNFTKLTMQMSRLQRLSDNISILTEMMGQYSYQRLLVSEQFAFGGENMGRAYDPSEILGDHGAAGKLELQYSSQIQPSWINATQYYAYYDAGITWFRKGDCGCKTEERIKTATSAGAGFRVNITNNISGYLEVAKPLTRNVAAKENQDKRYFVSISARM